MANNKKIKEIQQYRRDGMLYAVRQIRNRGLEDFEKEIGYKSHMKIAFDFPQEAVREIYNNMNERLYQTLRVCIYLSVRKVFGAGKVRMKRLADEVDNMCGHLLANDPWNNPYLTFEDLANELKETCGIDCSYDTIRKIDDENMQTRMKERRTVDIAELYSILNHNKMWKAIELIKKEELLNYGDTLSYTQFQEMCKEELGIDCDAV